MVESEQKVTEIIDGLVAAYKMKGSVSTNALCDVLEKYDLGPNQIGLVAAYKMKGSVSTNALCDVLEKYDLGPNQIEQIYKALRSNRSIRRSPNRASRSSTKTSATGSSSSRPFRISASTTPSRCT